MRVTYKQTAHRILLMLCVIFCVCLLLTRPVNETQSEDAGAYQGEQIPPGMTIVTVPVSDKTMPDKSLLYPGCVVGVKATWELSRSRIPEIIPDFIVNTLIKCKIIRNRGRTIYSGEYNGSFQVLSIKRGVRGTFVNLIVDPNQAEALSLAKKNGTLSLSIRKPLDRKLQPLHNFHIVPCPDEILPRHKSNDTPVTLTPQNPRWEVTVIRGRTVQRISPETVSSRQQHGLSSLSTTDENGDKWILKLARGQSLSSLEDNSAIAGPPLLVKTDVQISGRNVSINLIVEGKAGEKYTCGIQKNGQRQPPPGFNIVDEAGKVLTSGRFKYG